MKLCHLKLWPFFFKFSRNLRRVKPHLLQFGNIQGVSFLVKKSKWLVLFWVFSKNDAGSVPNIRFFLKWYSLMFPVFGFFRDSQLRVYRTCWKVATVSITANFRLWKSLFTMRFSKFEKKKTKFPFARSNIGRFYEF